MKFVDVSQKTSVEQSVAGYEKSLADLADETERVKKGADANAKRMIKEHKDAIKAAQESLTIWEAEQHNKEEPLEILTISGRATVAQGDYIFSNGDRRMAVPKEVAENTDLWVDVSEAKK